MKKLFMLVLLLFSLSALAQESKHDIECYMTTSTMGTASTGLSFKIDHRRNNVFHMMAYYTESGCFNSSEELIGAEMMELLPSSSQNQEYVFIQQNDIDNNDLIIKYSEETQLEGSHQSGGRYYAAYISLSLNGKRFEDENARCFVR